MLLHSRNVPVDFSTDVLIFFMCQMQGLEIPSRFLDLELVDDTLSSLVEQIYFAIRITRSKYSQKHFDPNRGR